MPERSIIASPIAYKLNIKRTIVSALRSVFDSDYPDLQGQIPNLLISMEWPDKPEQYPSIIINYRENNLASAGIGHFEHINGGPNVYRRWLYQGQIELLIAAETSLQRDYISDHLVHLLAFGSTSQYTNIFVPALTQSQGLDIQVLTDTLSPTGENVESGSSWGVEDFRVYTTGYSFGVFGSFTSGIVYNAYIRGVNETAEII